MHYHYKLWSLVLFFLSVYVNQIQALEREELSQLRDYHSKTFLNPDGSYTTEISAGYMHFRDASGRFRNIERQFVPSAHADYLYELTSGLYEVFW